MSSQISKHCLSLEGPLGETATPAQQHLFCPLSLPHNTCVEPLDAQSYEVEHFCRFFFDLRLNMRAFRPLQHMGVFSLQYSMIQARTPKPQAAPLQLRMSGNYIRDAQRSIPSVWREI